MHQIKPESEPITSDDDSLYPYVNNDIKYGLFEDIVNYYLDSQIKDDFQCDHDCYSQYRDLILIRKSQILTHNHHTKLLLTKTVQIQVMNRKTTQLA